MNFKFALAVLPALVCQTLYAQTERDLDSHEHGAATLNIAVDDAALIIELNSPWNNLVGFEHKPGNDEQEKAVEDALETLDHAEKLFAFSGTSCVAVETLVESSIEMAHDEEHGHDDDHDKEHDEHAKDEHHDENEDEHAKDEHHDDHDDEHAKDEHHDDHDDEHAKDEHHDDHDDEESTHSSVEVMYSFSCDELDKLSAINTQLFEVWPGFEEVDVQLIGPGGQGFVELTANDSEIDLSGVQ